jgi:hypothetical protein
MHALLLHLHLSSHLCVLRLNQEMRLLLLGMLLFYHHQWLLASVAVLLRLLK